MKNIFILFVLLISFVNTSYSQSEDQIKGVLEAYVKGTPPLENYHTLMVFNNVIKADIEPVVGKTLTNEEFENIIIFCVDVYRQGRTGWIWSRISTADLRDMSKIEIKKWQGDVDAGYFINIYFHGYYHKNFYSRSISDPEPKNEYLDKMQISIGNNYNSALEIKKCLIHLGKLRGITVTDGN